MTHSVNNHALRVAMGLLYRIERNTNRFGKCVIETFVVRIMGDVG